MFSSTVLTYSLNSRWRATTFITGFGLAGILLAAQIAQVAVAEHLGQSTDLAKVGRAATLDPTNPRYQHRLGLLQEFDWQHMDLAEAVRHFKAATMLQPNSAEYWSSLGRACFTIGDDHCADQAYETSVRLAPGMPRYQWETANYYLIAGRQHESVSHFRRFLELSADDPTPVFRICQKAFGDPELIWQNVLPGSDSNLRLTYINFLNESGSSEAAFQYWNRIVSEGSTVRYSAVQPYLDLLIARNHIQQAFKVWRDLQNLGSVQRPSGIPGNIVFNGGFELKPLNSGFDWRIVPEEYVALDFEGKSCNGNDTQRCLRVDFPVANNADYEPIYQIVPVEPDRHYVLTSHVRSSEISSDSGPRLRVVDPECPTCLTAESPASIGTTSWHNIAVNFVTGPKTQAIHVSVWRPRARSFPMEIQGSFWVSSVSLKAAPDMMSPQRDRLQ